MLNGDALPQSQHAAFEKRSSSRQHPVPFLAEPHAAWVTAVEHAWLQRYGSR